MKPPTSCAGRLLSILMALVLVLAVAETAARLVFRMVQPEFAEKTNIAWDSLTMTDLDPTGPPWWHDPRVRIGPEAIELPQSGGNVRYVPFERRPGVARVACLGGSLASRPSELNARNWADILESELGRIRPAEVLALGVRSWDPAQALAFFQRSLLPLQTDLILLQLGPSDVNEVVVAPKALGQKKKGWSGSDVQAVVHREMTFGLATPRLYLLGRHLMGGTISPNKGSARGLGPTPGLARALTGFRDAARAERRRLAIVVFPAFREGPQDEAARMLDEAHQAGILALDLTPSIRKAGALVSASPGGLVPTDAGLVVAAEATTSWLREKHLIPAAGF
jgi:hypothetical protein